MRRPPRSKPIKSSAASDVYKRQRILRGLYHQKSDIFGGTMTYSPDKEGKGIFVQIPG